jgi:S-adenosylmethionine synthetase
MLARSTAFVGGQIAESEVAEIPGIAQARCLIVSRIGEPATSPALTAVNIASHERRSVTELHNHIEAIAVDRLARIPALVDDFVNGTIELY